MTNKENLLILPLSTITTFMTDIQTPDRRTWQLSDRTRPRGPSQGEERQRRKEDQNILVSFFLSENLERLV